MQNPKLKEVLPYIPYNVQAQDEHGNLRTVTIEHQTYDQNTVGINHVLCNGLFFKKHNLVLRPWSDLTKEIEVNGEKFVPIERLRKDYTGFFFESNPELLIKSKNTSMYISLNWTNEVIQKLLEWHFNIFA